MQCLHHSFGNSELFEEVSFAISILINESQDKIAPYRSQILSYLDGLTRHSVRSVQFGIVVGLFGDVIRVLGFDDQAMLSSTVKLIFAHIGAFESDYEHLVTSFDVLGDLALATGAGFLDFAAMAIQLLLKALVDVSESTVDQIGQDEYERLSRIRSSIFVSMASIIQSIQDAESPELYLRELRLSLNSVIGLFLRDARRQAADGRLLLGLIG